MAINFRFGADSSRVSVLMVCTANICRSPLAQGMLARGIEQRGLGKQIEVDSAGTQGGMEGQRPDPRAQAVARQAGVDISRLKARKLKARDIERFHYLLAMDADHLEALREICPEEQHHKLALIMDFASRNKEAEIPDPYFGNEAGFQRVLELLEDATEGLLNHILQQDFPEMTTS